MSDWNQEQGARDYRWIIEEVKLIRDGIQEDVIDFYYETPTSANENTEKRDGIRRYLRDARDRINRLLDNQLAP